MLEITGDIFEQKDVDAICFTSNGVLNKHGNLVMGAGIALAFRDKFPPLAAYAGDHVKRSGNRVGVLMYVQKNPNVFYCFGEPPESEKIYILNFPTKNHYRDNSDLNLIVDSAKQLAIIADNRKWKKICLSRPGCGLGGLDWQKQVKPVIKDILNDRFVIMVKE